MSNATMEYPPLPTWVIVSLTLFNIVGIPFAIVGNLFVFIGSLKYNALDDLGGIIVVLIQGLSLCDLALTVFKWITESVIIIANKWVLGDFLCYMAGHFSHCIAIIEFVLVASMAAFKFYTLMFPVNTRNNASVKGARVYVLSVSIFCAVYRFGTMCFGSRSMYLPEMLTCEPSDLHRSGVYGWKVYDMFTLVVFLIFPVIITVTCNIGIIVYAVVYAKKKRMGKRHMPSKSAIFTISSISWVFVLSISPTSIRVALQVLGVRLPVWYTQVHKNMFWFNVICNPICYTLTNNKFKRYIYKMVAPPSWAKVISMPVANNVNNAPESGFSKSGLTPCPYSAISPSPSLGPKHDHETPPVP